MEHALAGGLPPRGHGMRLGARPRAQKLPYGATFLDPWLAGAPPFVISDAFPGNSLPAPAILPLWWDWAPEQRKQIKQLRWLSTDDFSRVQRGVMPHLEEPRVTVRDHVRSPQYGFAR